MRLVPTSLLALSAATVLTACAAGPAVGPNYQSPNLESKTPLHWLTIGKEKSTESALKLNAEAKANLNLAWWEDFNDPTLNGLIAQALQNNGDLKIALAKVEEARGARLAAQAETLPNISAGGNITRGRAATSGKVGTLQQGTLDASWELDLFGGNRRASEAARATLAAYRASAREAQVRLVAEVANSYLNVRSLQNQLQATRQSLKDLQEVERLVTAQQAEGLASTLTVMQTQAERADVAAQVPGLEAGLQGAIYSLGVLVGQTPPQIQNTLQEVKPVPTSRQTVLVGTPAATLAARPDVATAERNLAAATANQGVAMAQWFPNISLTGLFGLAHTAAVGTVHPWSWGTAATLPVLDFGRIRGLLHQANARQQAALAIYEQTVNAALADVETSLTGYLKAQEKADKLTEAATLNAKALAMAKAQQKEGVASMLDVLTAEQKLLAANAAKAAGDAAVGQSLATLYKALGGKQL